MDFELSAQDVVDMAFTRLCTVLNDKVLFLKYRNMVMLYHNVCINFNGLLDIHLQDVCIKAIVDKDSAFISRLLYGNCELIIDMLIHELWYADIDLIKLLYRKYPNKRINIFKQALKNKDTNSELLDLLYIPNIYMEIDVLDFLVACGLNHVIIDHVKKVDFDLYTELMEVYVEYDLQIKT